MENDITKKQLKKIESESFKMLVDIVDAWDMRDSAMLYRRIRVAYKFLNEKYTRRADLIKSMKGVKPNERGGKTKES